MNLHKGKWKRGKAKDIPILGIWRHRDGGACFLRLPNEDMKLGYEVVGICIQETPHSAEEGEVRGCVGDSNVDMYIGE